MLGSVKCLHSIVKNTSGGALTFAFLPPHGRLLAANEELIMFGSPLEAIQTGIDRSSNVRNMKAFDSAVAHGLLTIVSTPAPILESPGGSVYALTAANDGSVTGTTPCWHSTGTFSDSLDA
jgi:hypothetical protein